MIEYPQGGNGMELKELAKEAGKQVAESVCQELAKPDGERNPEPMKAGIVSAVIGIFSWLIRKILFK